MLYTALRERIAPVPVSRERRVGGAVARVLPAGEVRRAQQELLTACS
ncbi:hypothetical protein WMF37_17465 [Sorangium sp. So ce291]